MHSLIVAGIARAVLAAISGAVAATSSTGQALVNSNAVVVDGTDMQFWSSLAGAVVVAVWSAWEKRREAAKKAPVEERTVG